MSPDPVQSSNRNKVLFFFLVGATWLCVGTKHSDFCGVYFLLWLWLWRRRKEQSQAVACVLLACVVLIRVCAWLRRVSRSAVLSRILVYRLAMTAPISKVLRACCQRERGLQTMLNTP